MGKGMLRGEPDVIPPRTVVGPMLEGWAERGEVDLVTETFAEDGTAHPAVVLLTKLGPRVGLRILEDPGVESPEVAPGSTAQQLADEALRSTVGAVWWVTEAGSPAVFTVDVRFPPGHNGDDVEREGADLDFGITRRLMS
jgi:hypothetical protein